jgi:hypothetical protein
MAFVRVCGENVHAVIHILLVFMLRLEHEALEDVITPRNDAIYYQIRKEKPNIGLRTLFLEPNSGHSPGIAEYALSEIGVVEYLPFTEVP